MLHIENDTTKTLTFYLQPSLIAPIYLLSLVNYTTRERKNFIAPEVSTIGDMLQFTVTEVGTGSQSLLTGNVSIFPNGRYTLEVYEQTSTTSLDETIAIFLGDDELMVTKVQTYNAPPERNIIIVPITGDSPDYNNDYNNDYLIMI